VAVSKAPSILIGEKCGAMVLDHAIAALLPAADQAT